MLCSALSCLNLLDFVAILRVQLRDLLAEMRLDVAAQVHRSLRVHQIDGQTALAKAPGAPDSMQIRVAVGATLHVDGQIKVHHNRHLLDVDAARQNVGGDQHLLEAGPESIQHRQTLLDGQIAGQHGHRMSVRREFGRQPAGRFARVTEHDGLADGDHAVDVLDGPVLGVDVVAAHVVLFDVVQ